MNDHKWGEMIEYIVVHPYYGILCIYVKESIRGRLALTKK